MFFIIIALHWSREWGSNIEKSAIIVVSELLVFFILMCRKGLSSMNIGLFMYDIQERFAVYDNPQV